MLCKYFKEFYSVTKMQGRHKPSINCKYGAILILRPSQVTVGGFSKVEGLSHILVVTAGL